MKLIITRPEPLASRTAEKLRSLGHEVCISPLMEIVDTGLAIPKTQFSILAVTSINALNVLKLRGLNEWMLGTPVFAVGDASATEAESLGFARIHSASGTAAVLATEIAKYFSNLADTIPSVLHPCGVDTTPDFCAKLQDSQIEVHSWPLYKAILVDQLTKNSMIWLQNNDPVGILLYSTRSAQQFSSVSQIMIPQLNIDKVRIFAISKGVKHALSKSLQQRCTVAMQPNEGRLFDLLDNQ